MHETVSTLITIRNSLETGSYDSPINDQNSKQSILLIAEQLKTSMNESDSIRGRLELKDEELLDFKKLIKIKHDELSELNIRLSLNEKKIENLQKELEEKDNKYKQILEELKIDGQKKIK
jgi:dynactin 1